MSTSIQGLTVDENVIAGIRGRLDRPLVIIGLMGSGKTRLGRLLADALQLPFTDSDDEIEKAAGLSVAEIFDRFGEEYFRDGERRIIKRLVEDDVRIISTGGGAMMTPETADAVFQKKALSLWIRAELPVMLKRVARNDKRPLLRGGDPADILRSLMEKRYPTYGRADIIVDSDNGPVEMVLSQALNRLDLFLRQRKLSA